MPGVFEWIKDQANAVYSGVESIISTAATAVSTVGSVAHYLYSSKGFRAGLSDWLTQSMEGFWRALSPSNYTTMIKTDKTSGLWLSGMASTFMRIAPVMLYRTIARPLATEMVRNSVGSVPGAETVTMTALDVAATLLIIKATTRTLANNVENSLSMAKASANESKPVEQADNPLTKACVHGKKANLSAAATSTLHYYGTLFALRGFANSIPYGDLVTLPLEMLLIGRTYLEYPLRAANNCDAHSLEVLNKNNPYAFGIGASYKATEYLTKHYVLGAVEAVIEHYTGLKTAGPTNFFIEELLSAMLSLHFIMTSNLQRNAKLPGTKPGVDIFEPCRDATDAFAQSVIAKAKRALAGPKVDNWYEEGKKQFQAVTNHTVMVWICKLLLDEDLQNWEKFKDRDESKLFFALYGNMLLNGIRYVQKKRARTDYKLIDQANQYAMNTDKDESFLKIKSLGKYIIKKGIDAVASEDDQEMLAFLMQPELEAPLNDWYDYIYRAIPPDVGVHVEDLDIDIVEDYQVTPVGNDKVVIEDVAPAPATVRPPAPAVAPTPPQVAQTANFRLFTAGVEKNKSEISMKANTDKALEEFARIVAGGKL